jgi:hypothetical protein
LRYHQAKRTHRNIILSEQQPKRQKRKDRRMKTFFKISPSRALTISPRIAKRKENYPVFLCPSGKDPAFVLSKKKRHGNESARKVVFLLVVLVFFCR